MCAKLDRAAALGQLSEVETLLAQNAPCSTAAVDLASARGHTEVLQLLLAASKPSTTAAVDWACANNNWECVVLLLNCFKCGTKKAIEAAAAVKNSKLVNLLLSTDHEVTENAVRLAVEFAEVTLVSKLQQKANCSWHQVTDAILNHDRLDIWEFISDQGLALDDWVLCSACAKGSVLMVKQLINEGLIPDQNCLLVAASKSHLQVLKLLRGVTPNEETMQAACMAGNIEVVAHLQSIHGELSTECLCAAVANDHRELVYFLCSQFEKQAR